MEENKLSLKRLIIEDTVSQTAGKIISAGLTFTATVIIAKTLGSEGYGDLTKVLTFVSLFLLLTDFGINPTAIQEAKSASEEKKAQVFSSLLLLRIIFGLFLIFISFGILMFLPYSQNDGYTMKVKIGILVYLVSIIFQGIIVTSNSVFQFHHAYKYNAIAQVAGSITLFFLVIVSSNLFLPGPLFYILVFIFLFTTAVAASVSLYFALKYFRMNFSVSALYMKRLFVLSLPLGLTLFANALSMRFDSYVLTIYQNTSQVGVYGLAYRIFETVLVLPTFFMNSVFPSLIFNQNDKDSLDLFKRRIKNSSLILFFLSLVAIIVTYLVSPVLIKIRPDFSGSIIAIRILALGFPGFFLSSVLMWAMIAKKYLWKLLFIYTAIFSITAISDLVFIPHLGYIAASWITVLSEYLTLAVLGIYLKYNIDK